jgi:bacillopeptidase F (M6 metalloprotease family)
LSDYADQTVEIAFNFHSDNAYTAPGWYIDDVSLEVGPYIFTSPQDWESGLDDWHVDYGSWEVGVPATGPENAHGGENCIATNLDDDYSNHVDSRLISPPFLVCPEVSDPVLRFWHWYSFYPMDNDYGQVQIRVVGDSDWDTLAEYRNNGGGIWTQPYISIPPVYSGETVEIAFYFHTDNAYTAPGWYIDDVTLQGGITPVKSDADSDGDIDGSDLHHFADTFIPKDDLARFAMEFGLIACQ